MEAKDLKKGQKFLYECNDQSVILTFDKDCGDGKFFYFQKEDGDYTVMSWYDLDCMTEIKEMDVMCCDHFKNATEKLSKLTNRYMVFNGKIIHSNQSIDDMYRKYYGLSKEYIEKCKSILEPEKLELWEKVVPLRLNDLYRGMELQCCLDICKILKEQKSDSFQKAIEELKKQNHSGASFGLVLRMVREFAVNGEQFVSLWYGGAGVK